MLKGLSKKEAKKKLEQYGPNEIKDTSKTTPFKILLRQIKSNFIIYLLFVTTIISFFVGKHITAYTIIVIILVIIVSGFVQEYRSEQAIQALKNMLVPLSVVIRDGKEKEIKSSEIVPGDIILLRTGEKVPADSLLLEEKELLVNESILTGEAKEVRKSIAKKEYKEENLVFMGTFVVSGRCVAKVLHTGMKTKFGKIAGMISKSEKELPLQIKVNTIAKWMVVIGITIAVLTALMVLKSSSVINEEILINVLILTIAIAVSAFPESFPVVLITTLAVGAHHMAQKNAIVNRMSIIETLGETTVICSDKTGTITKGEMTVKKVYQDNKIYDVTGVGYNDDGNITLNNKQINLNENFKNLLYNAILCNDSSIERGEEKNDYNTIGSPTESALLILGVKAKIHRDDLNFERLEEIPFSSERKMMSVLCKINKDKYIYSKGALEYVIKKCSFIQKGNKVIKLTNNEKKKILEANKKMTSEALRTIAFAYKKVNKFVKTNFEKDLIFNGLAGIEDPPREEVKQSLNLCYKAGIKVKMITGDNKETAMSIAKDIGLKGKVMTGDELEKISEDKLKKIINSIMIFARVKPEHKVKIVNALKANGEVVVMTGDGVNDTPALKVAHVGIAMGKKGTDVSRSVADMTLKDDNFSTIVEAISEGRTIFKNIRKFTTYQLSCNGAELGVLFFGVFLSPIFGWQIPLLLALQILFMNLVTADLPAIGLGLNPHSEDSMIIPPRKDSNILNKNVFKVLIFTTLVKMLLVLFSYLFIFNYLEKSHSYAQTTALLTLIGLEIVSAFNFRSFRKGIFNKGLLVNKYLFWASVISLVLTFVIIYTPARIIFETVPLNWDGVILAIILSLSIGVLFDILKYLNNKFNFIELEHV